MLAQSRGKLIADLLARSWRVRPPALEISPGRLTEAAPALLATGSAPLAWRCLAYCEIEYPAALDLKEAYYFHAIRATFHEYEIEQVFGLLRAAGVEPLLAKGWSAARLYPEPGLRPYGDIDLFVTPADRRRAAAALASPEGLKYNVDLAHEEFARISDRAADDLYARSKLVRLGGTQVRLLGPEDHLRVLCLHAVRHYVWRPLWLCDIAVAVESLPERFDWEICFGADKREANWVASLIGLARELLRAELPPDASHALAQLRPPRWVGPALLRDWGRWAGPGPAERVAAAVVKNIKNPLRVAREIYSRWDRPIKATVEVGGRFIGFTPVPFQLAYTLLHTPMILRQLTRQPYRSPGWSGNHLAE